MRKLFIFMLLAASLLISLPSWAYVEGTQTTLGDYTSYFIGNYGNTNSFGTICVPERIVATQGITIYDVLCVDVEPKDSTKVARLAVDVHTVCSGSQQGVKDDKGEVLIGAEDLPFCPYEQGTGANSCEEKVYIDWINIDTGWDDVLDRPNLGIDHRMKAGAAYFYTICAGIDNLAKCSIWVDESDKASAPVCQNGFYGTFEQTQVNTPVTVLTQDKDNNQFLETVSSATIPAHRGYFKGYFECVPWRWNTDSPDFTEEFKKKWGVTTTINPLHYPCTGKVKPAPKLSSNAVMFNVGRDAATGLYQVDFEHPIYLNEDKEEGAKKCIENGQLVIEVNGMKYNAFGQRIE